MPRVHLIEGPVGAGKSTFASSLSARVPGIHIALDEWFVKLFSPDRPIGDFVPWYIERKDRLLALIWDHSRRLLDSGQSVILEFGLIQREARTAFCHQVTDEGFELVVHVLDAPLEVRRERVRRRNTERGATYSMVVPENVFEMASNLWEAPDDVECAEFKIEFMTSESAEAE